MPDDKTVLKTAYEALHQEFSRISYLIKPIGKHPLGEYAQRIQGKFGDSISQVKNELGKINQALIGKGVSLEHGWDAYVRLKTDLIPSLSNELLAVIGGIHIIDAELDYVSGFQGASASQAGQPTTKFSGIAQKLVEDLDDRGNRGWAPVLIVGEERLGHSVAGIIRLRFPACDIWHLPFTAHEYGYLVAQITPPDPFSTLRVDVEHNVDPEKQLGNTPADRSCFLEAIQSLWDEYYGSRDNFSQNPGSFSKRYEQELNALKKQQKTHLCRLFADAFATLFVGPAYVYALLHLRFIPDETLYKPSAAMPPFAHRFVFALETLKWMNRRLLASDTAAPSANEADEQTGPFANEVDETIGIASLWRLTLQSTNQHDRYAQIAKDYELWLSRIKKILKNSFSDGFDGTLKHWDIAKQLKDELIKTELQVNEWPLKWAVLNAAWSARWDKPTQWETIQHNALLLLGEPDPNLIKRGETLKGPKQEEMLPTEQAVKIIEETLLTEPENWPKFQEMSKSGVYKKDDDILKTLGKRNIEAYKAYVSLYSKEQSSRTP